MNNSLVILIQAKAKGRNINKSVNISQILLSCHISEHSFPWSTEEELVGEDLGIQDSSCVLFGDESLQSPVIPLSSKERGQAFYKNIYFKILHNLWAILNQLRHFSEVSEIDVSTPNHSLFDLLKDYRQDFMKKDEEIITEGDKTTQRQGLSYNSHNFFNYL